MTPAQDAGNDAGGCPPPCTPPPLVPLCPDLDGGTCAEDVPCCPGLLCSDAGRCVLPPNPCPNGERPRTHGCGCDPMTGATGGCSPGYACLPDLHCHLLDAGAVDAGSQTCAPLCEPNSATPLCIGGLPSCGCATSLPNGLADSCYLIGQICDTNQRCRPPGLGEPCDPGPGAGCPTAPFLQQRLSCSADPSGAHLYICTAICTTNADCANGWQFCSRLDGGAFGHCVDNPCSRPYAPCSLHLPGGSGAAQGLCLPFGVIQTNPDGTKEAVSFGLCLEASVQSGATGVACDRLFRRADDGGIGPPGGPGSFCNLVNVCSPSGACAPACNLSDGKPCPSAGPHCKRIDPRPFATARDPDSGVLVGSGACQ
jgi:hypothetical protein